MRYLLKIKYDGSKFYGFQRLNDLPTIQKEIEEALFKIYQENIVIKGAGRTDKGVHAYGQRAHFEVNKHLPKLDLKRAINSLISEYIYVSEVREVDCNFHARFDVKQKRYEYKINVGEYNPLEKDYCLQLNYPLDIAKIEEASKIFLGVHDFENFISGTRDNYVAKIDKVDINYQDNILTIGFEGKSFYRYMVRGLVGALIDVGKGKVSIEELEDSLAKKSNQRFSVALPNGLYLIDIKY